ncbi:hypothetical protein IWQ62_002109, partial [Dispira parvispora]
ALATVFSTAVVASKCGESSNLNNPATPNYGQGVPPPAANGIKEEGKCKNDGDCRTGEYCSIYEFCQDPKVNPNAGVNTV